MRGTLGIYSDDIFRVRDDGVRAVISTDQAFLLFAARVGAGFEGVVFFGRTVRGGPVAEIVLPGRPGLVELPHYESLRRTRAVLRAAVGTVAGMWRGLSRVDVVWVLGPNPFGIVLIVLALMRRKRVALGVRQDTVAYFRSRLSSRRWTPALGLAQAMDGLYRLLARRLPTTVVGEQLAHGYGADRPSVLPMTVTLVHSADVAPAPPSKDWSGPIELLTVGRIDVEKNPLLLVDAFAQLRDQERGDYRLRWVGRGPLESAVRRRALELGVADDLELAGFVPFGPSLLDLYRQAHVFVHVALTEGVPQVLIEALACGTPIVGTDVGGVRAALGDGRAGLLVPPGDCHALVGAVRRLRDDASLRDRVVSHGLRLARETTIEHEADRVARFIADARS